MAKNLEELYAYKAKYEKEKLFAEAKIAVVDDMIADAKTEETTEEVGVSETFNI